MPISPVILDELLSWDINTALHSVRAGGHGGVDESSGRIPNRFLDEGEYIRAFSRPAIAELKASILQTLCTESLTSYPVTLEGARKVEESAPSQTGSLVEAVARFVVPPEKRDWTYPAVSIDTLCFLSNSPKLDDFNKIGLCAVIGGKMMGCVRLCMGSLMSGSPLFLSPIQSLVSVGRELDALLSISDLGLKEELLLGIPNGDSRKTNRLRHLHHLPPVLMEAFEKKLNGPQKQVIDTLCDLNLIDPETGIAHASPKIVLVQGPPGTGKTMTLNAVLNALHVQQYNAYYRSIVEAVRQGKFVLNNERSWLDLTTVAKPRIIVCAPSNVAIDNIILRVQSEKFLDGSCRQYVPRLVRIGKGATSNYEVAETALSSLVDSLTSESLKSISTKIKSLESKYSEYRHGVIVQVTKLQCMIAGSPYLFRKGIETRVTTNVAGLLVAYWADHISKTTYGDLPKPVRADLDPPESPGPCVEEMEEYKLYSQELMRFLELWEETHWQLQRCRLVHAFLSESGGSNNMSAEKYSLQQSLETLFMNEASIVCGTLNSTGLSQVRESSPFQTCVVDEAAQAVELSTLIPLKLGVKKLVLIGDPKQLPATIISTSLEHSNYERSLLERLEQCGLPVHVLSVQYRMHPSISDFPRKIFYDSILTDADSVKRRPLSVFAAPPFNLNPFMFVDVLGARESSGSNGVSKCNPAEAAVCVGLYFALTKMGVFGKGKFGIISPYAEQVKLLRDMFHSAGVNLDTVEIATVDSFQGKEKEIIILSTVRAGNQPGEFNSVGFLADMRRMNVALTRAKNGLFVVGNSDTLGANPTWGLLVHQARSIQNAYLQVPAGVKDIFGLLEKSGFFR